MKLRLTQIVLLAVALSALPSFRAQGQAAVALSHNDSSRSTLQTLSFYSKALQRTMPYEIVLPPGYSSSQERYPVLYLLHGWHGDETNYTTLTTLLNEASLYRLIVVMPRGANSWYVNSATAPADRYADYIFVDLVNEVDSHFRTQALPSSRAIAGLSMGGYGALLLSLEHPGAFGFVGSLSGAFDGPSGIENVMPVLKPSTDAAFGAQRSEARRADNLDSLIAGDAPSAQPYFFLACGTSDPLLNSNRRIVSQLSNHRFAYEYHELPGAHTWTFWSGELRPMLASLSSVMRVTHVSADPTISADPTNDHLTGLQ